jgi:hypothetical protein
MQPSKHATYCHEVHMATPDQEEQATGQPSPPQDRNEPAIDSQSQNDGADVGANPSTATDQSQSQSDAPAPVDAEKSAYVPDYEPQHKPATQRNLQPTQGHDADIDTQGG